MLYLHDFDLTRVVAGGNNCIVLGQFIINIGLIQQSLEDASASIYFSSEHLVPSLDQIS